MKVYEYIAETLKRQGVRRIFGLMSDDNLDLLVALHHRCGVEVISARHEQPAVSMADGYARASGTMAVCTVGRGPAVAQTGTALVTAQRHRSPLLVLVPAPATTESHSTKHFEQEAFLRATVGTVMSLRNPRAVPDELARAFRHVASGRGPVALNMPEDVLQAEIDFPPLDFSAESWVPQRVSPDPARVEEAVALLATSERPPVILVGRGALGPGVREEIEGLAARLGAYLCNTLLAMGYFHGHPYNLGLVGSFATPEALELASSADCVLALGCSLNERTTHKGHMFPHARFIHVDRDPAAIGEITPVDVGIVGDVLETVRALNAMLDAEGIDRRERFWTSAVADHIGRLRNQVAGYERVPGKMDPREFIAEVNGLLPDERVIVTDGGHCLGFVLDGITIRSPREFIWPRDFSAIGVALPAAIGVALARGERERCILFVGDTGFMMAMQEVETAARFGVPLTAFIMNDSAMGVEVRKAQRKGHPTDLGRYTTPEFADVARALGARGFTVRSAEELRALAPELFTGGPVVVDVKINPDVTYRNW